MTGARAVRPALASGQRPPGGRGRHFDAAGDQAAYDAQFDAVTTNLAVDTPADSPYATASGGTTTPWSGTVTGSGGTFPVSVPAQRAWGWDYLWAPTAAANDQS